MTFRQFAYRNVIRNKRTYAAYFLSSAFSVMIFFVYALFIFHPDIQNGVTNIVAVQLMVAAEIIMFLFSFFFVLYSVSSFLKTRKREFGICMMLGMTRGQLNRLVFLENMIIGAVAIVLGMGLGCITGKLFFMIGSSMLQIDTLPFHLSVKAIILTIGAFLFLFFFISLFTSILIRTNKLIDLFQSGQKPKKKPRVSVLLSLISALLLGVSYYLAATTTMETIVYRILPVIAMTIVGTYFFYTQLSVFIIRLLQKKKWLFWRKTNMVTISNLAYRLKDNARMFFLVTIVSTVAFCAVGTLASMNVLNEQFEVDYPAAISYVGKDQQPIHHENLHQIKEELHQRHLDYEIYEMPITYVKLAESTDSGSPQTLPVISFSDYRKMAMLAGFDFTEEPLKGKDVLGMKTDRFEIGEESATYTLVEKGMKLHKNRYTEHVVFPRELVENEGLILSDELFKQLKIKAREEMYTGFFVQDFSKTGGISNHLAGSGSVWHEKNKPYTMVVSGTILETQKNLSRMMLFIALMIGTVFFIAAGSFLYFRLYADLDYDQRQYSTIMKMGLTDQELTKIVTRQLFLLFFVPIIVVIVHSIFAFMALQSFFTLSIANEMIVVLACFFIAQVLYFFIIRNQYLKKLKKGLGI